MTRVQIDGESYACPFADLFRPHTPAERAEMLASVREFGILDHVFTYLSDAYGRAILDGVNRARIGNELEVDVPEFCLGRMPDARAKQMALALNFARRHLSPEEQQAARGKRVIRVCESVPTNGIRGTARLEGISPTQVLRDIEDAETGVTVVTPRKLKPYHARAHKAAARLLSLVGKLARGNRGERFALLAEQAGIPLDGKQWPALAAVAAVLRDVAGGAASA